MPVDQRFWRAAAHQLLRGLRDGGLELTDPLGRVRFGRGRGPRFHIQVTDLRAYRSLLRGGSVGMGESYGQGWWEADDLTGLLRLAHRNTSRLHPVTNRVYSLAAAILDPFARRQAPNPARDRRNIHSHYDLGNDFFSTILDETMMYSCAIFEPPGIGLADASRAKLRAMVDLAGITPDHHVLEIGTGWGGFAEYVATEVGARVTTTTISAEQYGFAQQRIAAAGLTDRVTVLDADYRDLPGPEHDGKYDRIVSIEMIEAVNWREYEGFFRACRRLLTPTGVLAMQAIVIDPDAFDRAKHTTDFIKEAIFPGGCLPSVPALERAASAADLRLITQHDIGLHYAETLRHWRANLADADHQRGERFRRTWDFYFSYCEAGFAEEHISDVQLRFVVRPR